VRIKSGIEFILEGEAKVLKAGKEVDPIEP